MEAKSIRSEINLNFTLNKINVKKTCANLVTDTIKRQVETRIALWIFYENLNNQIHTAILSGFSRVLDERCYIGG